VPDVQVASGSIISAVESGAERSRLGTGAAAGGEVEDTRTIMDNLRVNDSGPPSKNFPSGDDLLYACFGERY
jgi:hypothetical protein